MQIGSQYLGNGKCDFVVWAPFLETVMLQTVYPEEQMHVMAKDSSGYWKLRLEGVLPGARYFYNLNHASKRPDPASHFQPEGVHGPSEIIDHHHFQWQDDKWNGIPLEGMIIYELHAGTFTPEGTFDAVIAKLDDLYGFGINAINIMPVAQFPGDRNWGYDGVYPFAVQNSYGGPAALKRLVNSCHRRGIAVILDVVYNHLGPEGNYLGEYGPYFTDKYKTLWGNAINFDEAWNDNVRNFFIENALYWFHTYHIDALRLDAVHAIYDMSAKPFLQELAEKVEELSYKSGKKRYLIAESDLNDVRVIRQMDCGGFGIDAQWSDDFHHSLHTLLTGENTGYYEDFGSIGHLARAFNDGFVYAWQYSHYRKRRHGSSSKDRPARQFVVCSQNHDQVGNRMLGERLSALVPFEALKLAAGAVLLSPYIPLLFMGEEYGEKAPFLYFVSHHDKDLIEAVRKGRKEEFQAFKWEGEVPDPQNRETFLQSKLDWPKRKTGRHKTLLHFYHALIRLRKGVSALSHLDKNCQEVWCRPEKQVLFFRRWYHNEQIFCLMNFNQQSVTVTAEVPGAGALWKKILDSSEEIFDGPGSLLPAGLESGQDLTIPSFGVAVYEQEISV